MRSNSWLWTIYKVVTLLLIVVFLALIYWSSVLQEERIRKVEERLDELSDAHFPKTAEEIHIGKTQRDHIDPNIPNILKEDPYFSTTLPKLLGNKFTPKGVLKMAIVGEYLNLHPFNLWYEVDKWYQYCQRSLSKELFGRYETVSQDLAIKIEERKGEREDLVDFWVHLREGVLWQPLEQKHFSQRLSSHFLKKYPVTAHDFKFTFDAIKNPNVDLPGAVVQRAIFKDVEKVKVIDDLTLVITYRKNKLIENGKTQTLLPYTAIFAIGSLRPLACFVYKYLPSGKKICPKDEDEDFYAKSSLWAQQFANHFASSVIVSCGSFIFDGISEEGVRFRRNPDFYDKWQALYEGVHVYFLESPGAIFRDFLAKKIDVCLLEPKNLIEVERYLQTSFYMKSQSKIENLKYLDLSFSYVGWNEKRPYFSEKKIRQALAQAIDYQRMIQQNLNGQAVQITGPFPYESKNYDNHIPQWTYNPDEAKRTLEKEGWYDSDGDGVIDKEIAGKRIPFRFSLTYFVKNLTSKANAEMISSQLKQIGIDCELHGVDITEISTLMDDKNIDALLLGWHQSAPPENPEQLWDSKGAYEKGSSNYINFINKTADHLIEQINFEHSDTKRVSLYHRLHKLLHEEAPYAFLYTPMVNVIYWNKLKNIFIPKERQDLIPEADITEPSFINGYIEE